MVLLKSATEHCRRCLYNEEMVDLSGPTIMYLVEFFNSSTMNKDLDLNVFLRSLLAYLAHTARVSAATRKLFHDKTKISPAGRSHSNSELEEVLLETLTEICHPGQNEVLRVYIFLDTLDEITLAAERKKVVSFLNCLAASDHSTIYILITSRPLALQIVWEAL